MKLKAASQYVGIIGPTNTVLVEEKAGLSSGALEKAAGEVGEFLANQSLGMVCVPVKGVPLWALERYKRAGGKDALALWPRASSVAETSQAQSQGRPELAHRVRDDLTWGEEPFELARISDCLVAIGLSCGTMIEMVATKWIKNTPVLAVRSLMTGIPAEIATELDLRCCDSLDSLKEMLSKTFAGLDTNRRVP
ncbi:MAG: hypothetical protein LJE96_16265 [Deltaproteobacteria bacterium]|nr:hypothetical protein [Deltaproteobacteria bacterium]